MAMSPRSSNSTIANELLLSVSTDNLESTDVMGFVDGRNSLEWKGSNTHDQRESEEATTIADSHSTANQRIYQAIVTCHLSRSTGSMCCTRRRVSSVPPSDCHLSPEQEYWYKVLHAPAG